jgi:hypothetical protein
MMRQRLTTTAILGFIALVIVASVAIMIGTQYQRAERAESKVAQAEEKLAAAKETEAALAYTEDELTSTRSNLYTVDRSLDRTTIENDAFSQRDDACGYLVRASSEILGTAVAYGKVSNHLLNDRQGHAMDLLPQIDKHIDATDKLVKDAGYSSISELMEACTPSSPTAAQ